MKISVYIPANIEHLPKLDNIISIYNNGVIVPDEIVVSVYGVNTPEQLQYLKDIHNKKYKNVSIYTGKMFGSLTENYNNALKFTVGDIICYHDSDYTPSVARVDIIKTYFEKYDINMLHHTTFNRDLYIDAEYNIADNNDIVTSDMMYRRYFPFNNIDQCWYMTRSYGAGFTITRIDDKSLTIKRDVLNKFKWKEPFEHKLYRGDKEGLFYELSMENLYTYNKALITSYPLTYI